MTEQNISDKKIELKNQLESTRTKIYMLMVEMIFIFSIPAIIAVYIGKKIDLYYNSGTVGMFSALGCAFLFSWTLVIRKYRIHMREIKSINEQIKNTETDR